MTYHFVYKTTNLINNKIYIGKHSTDNLEDGYIGSGKYLWRAIRKYGIENFKKEILEFFDTEQESLEGERKIVNDEFILREDTYNLQIGGNGGLFGMVSVKDKDGNNLKVSAKDPRYLDGELVGLNKGIPSWSKERTCITNGKENKFIDLEIENIPKGFWQGSYTKGRMGITNGKENKYIFIETEEIPEGFWEGSCRKGQTYIEESCVKNTTWFTNGEVDKRIDLEIEEAPEGFWRGSYQKGNNCITNGKENKFINLKTEEIPQGFWQGTKRSENWRLTSPSNKVFNFIGLQDFFDFCKDNNLSGNALRKVEGSFFKLGPGNHRELRKNTIDWKLDLIK